MDELLSAIVGAAVGTAVGALAAFAIEHSKRAREAADRDAVAGNLTIYQLSSLWRQLDHYQTHIVNVHRADPMRWYTMPDVLLRAEKLYVEPRELGFLFQSQHWFDLLPDVLNGVNRYQLVERLVRERHQLLAEGVQPLVDRTHVGVLPTPESIAEACGPAIREQLEGLTDGIIFNIDTCVGSLNKLAMELNRAVGALYPNRAVIAFVLNPTSEQPEGFEGPAEHRDKRVLNTIRASRWYEILWWRLKDALGRNR